MEVPCEGITIHIGIFSLGDYKYQSEVVNGGFAGLFHRSIEKEDNGDVEHPHIRLVPHQMLPHPGLVVETEKGGLVGNEVEGEKSALEEGTFNPCDSLKIAATSCPAINGDSIEVHKEDQEVFLSDPLCGLIGPPYSECFLVQKETGPDQSINGPGLKPNIRPKMFKAKQRNDFSSSVIWSKGPSKKVKENYPSQSRYSLDKEKSKPSFLYVYSKRNKNQRFPVWDNRVDV